MLEVQSLSVNYGSRQVLHEVSLNVARGEILALIGPNGAGKTTLLKTVSGVLRPHKGSICLDGRDLARLSTSQRARMMSVVPQARRLPETFTVWETVLLGRTPYLGWLGRPTEQDRQHIRAALERTDTMELAERRIGELSGGEQQRVLLARALAQDTPVLLMDEPTTHLDLHHQIGLLNLVKELAQEKNLATIMALHDLNLASVYADRVALLVNGKLDGIGAPKDVLTEARLSEVYRLPLHVINHPDLGVPLILPEGQGGRPVA